MCHDQLLVLLPAGPLASSPGPHGLNIPLINTTALFGGLSLTCKFEVHIQITALSIWGTGICGKKRTDTGFGGELDGTGTRS